RTAVRRSRLVGIADACGLRIVTRDCATVNACAVIALQAVGGTFSGVVAGSMRAFARTALGAPVVGTVAAIPFAAGCFAVIRGLGQWQPGDGLLVIMGDKMRCSS